MDKISDSYTTINLTVIGDIACSTTRTYLAYLREEGLRVKHLWLVRFGEDGSNSKKGLYSGIRTFLSRRNKEWVNDAFDGPFMALCNALQESAVSVPVDLFGSVDPGEYADAVSYFSARDFNDPDLQSRILSTSETAFLYTNGGIVPKALLSRDGIKFFHIHPGIVPQVRGSDCLLWSVLTRRRMGASCFYMSPGIDEGDLLGNGELTVPDCSALTDYLDKESEDLAYRALLYAVDPHLRALVFLKALRRFKDRDLRGLEAEVQNAPNRTPFLWMHPRLRLVAMKELVKLSERGTMQKLPAKI